MRDRVENMRRATKPARLMVDARLGTIVSFFSPFETERQAVLERLDKGEFFEAHFNTLA